MQALPGQLQVRKLPLSPAVRVCRLSYPTYNDTRHCHWRMRPLYVLQLSHVWLVTETSCWMRPGEGHPAVGSSSITNRDRGSLKRSLLECLH